MPPRPAESENAALPRPRVEKDAILIADDILLARRIVSGRCWALERPDDQALAKLLAKAYRRPVAATDRLCRSILHAASLLVADPRQAAAYLAALPAPDNDAPPLQKRDFPSKPAFSRTLALCAEGLVLGKGTLIASWREDASGAGLALDEQIDAIAALLSVAGLRPVSPQHVAAKWAPVARALSRGEGALAAIALAQSGLPPLANAEAADALALAATALAQGVSPTMLMKWSGLTPDGELAKFNPDEPRDDDGQWTDAANSPAGRAIDSILHPTPGKKPAPPKPEASTHRPAQGSAAPAKAPTSSQPPSAHGRIVPAGNGSTGFMAEQASDLSKLPAEIQAAAARYASAFGQVYGTGKNEGQCAQLTHAFDPSLGPASNWRPGIQVQGGDVAVGTPVATFNDFNDDGKLTYGPSNSPGGAHHTSHTGIYLGQDEDNIYILNQWHSSKDGPSGAIVSKVNWDKGGYESGHNYYTIK